MDEHGLEVLRVGTRYPALHRSHEVPVERAAALSAASAPGPGHVPLDADPSGWRLVEIMVKNMDRRTFGHVLAWGAGSIGVAQARAADPQTTGDDSPRGAETELPEAHDVVNVAGFQEMAAARLPKATYDYITSGSADEITLRENVAAFQRIGILPPLLHGVANADPSTTVLGQPISLPVMLAPVACQRMYHPEGALAAARAAAAAGTVYGMSSSVGHSVEQVARAAEGPKWFQLYPPKDRAVARRLVERADRAGFQAIIVTVDLGEWKDSDRRNRFVLPKDMLVKHLRDIGFTQISDTMSYEEVQAFNSQAWDMGLSWDFFDWLRGITKRPLVIKGVLRPEDARKAVSLGLDGIVVSNHGGRRLDGMPAAIDMLAEIVEAVGGKTEVFLDSGVRRGTDVLIALALGAKAVLIGRPYAWALAADGQAGVSQVIELLRDEFLNAMMATGCATTGDIGPSLVRIST